ncbi:hypothetical protein ACSLBF_15355 [Pseudoalteromonas sp. T1lg65]|uniref:hypothetical protein n=1 Tax=Pseudoalteromonas sp. T1lg65 TaxID=2077101 RepID=UPI003F7912A5
MKIIHFASFDNLRVYQDPTEEESFGIVCLKDVDGEIDPHDSKGYHWELPSEQVDELMQMIAKYKLDQGVPHWEK